MEILIDSQKQKNSDDKQTCDKSIQIKKVTADKCIGDENEEKKEEMNNLLIEHALPHPDDADFKKDSQKIPEINLEVEKIDQIN